MDEKFMSAAIKLAAQARDRGDYPYGAVVVKNGQIIGQGSSQELSLYDVTKHAETTAISSACRKLGTMDLTGCTLYASEEPCNMCAAAAFHANIGRVVIGATRDDSLNNYRQRSIRIFQLAEDSKHSVEVITGVLKDQAVELWRGFHK